MADGVPVITRLTNTYIQDSIMEAERLQNAKPPKPTKAERKAARKEQKRLEMIEEKRLVMRHELTRELELGKRMERQGTEEWHKMCKDIKIIELRQEMLEWGEHAHRNIERKNELITMLLDDMAQTQEQHTRSYGKTVDIIDHVSKCYRALLETVKTTYDEQAEELLSDYYEEIKRRTEEVDFMHENSENIILASNVIARDQLKLDYKIYLEKRDDRINTEIENRFRIRDHIGHKMEAMQRQLNEFVDMLSSTELDAHKYERIRWLTERQAAFMEETRKLNVEEVRYQNAISDMQREMTHVETENNGTINDLRLEFHYFSHVRKKIESSLQMDREITHEKLRILTNESYKIIKEFEKHVKSGELLLSLALNCRKMQTQSEKIVLGGEMYDECQLGEYDENFVVKTLDLQKHVDMTDEKFVAQNKMLHNFWRRQAMAEAQNLLLLEEKRKLTEENQSYIDFIKNVTKTENVEELKTAIVVSPCASQPMPPLLFDTPCLSYKLKSKRQKWANPSKSKDGHELQGSLELALDGKQVNT